MTSPSGDYGAWSVWLDAFARGEDLAADHLTPVDERIGPHAQARTVRRIASAFEARQALWISTFQRRMAVTSTSHQVTDLASAMIAARRRALPLRALAENRLLPDELRATLRDALSAMLRSTQESMENAVRHSGAEVLAAVRDNDLRRAMTNDLPSPPKTAAPVRGRRVIL